MKLNEVLLSIIKVLVTLVFLLLIVYAAVRLSTTGYDFGYRIFTEKPVEQNPGTDVLVQIKDGMSGKEIGAMLQDKGLIRDGNLFRLQYRLSAYYKKIRSGVYTLNTSMTAKEMIVILSGDASEESTESGVPLPQNSTQGADSTEEIIIENNEME